MEESTGFRQHIEGGGLFAVYTPDSEPAASGALSGLIGGVRHRATDKTELSLAMNPNEIITHEENGVGGPLENYFLSHANVPRGAGRVMYSTVADRVNRNNGICSKSAYINPGGHTLAWYSLGKFGKPDNFVGCPEDTSSYLQGCQVAIDLEKIATTAGVDVSEVLPNYLPIYEGPFALVALSRTSVVAARGIGQHQLVEGRIGDNVFFATEFPSLDILGVKPKDQRELEPGEMVIVNENGVKSYNFTTRSVAICLREFLDFSRDDNRLQNIGMYTARIRLGEELARLFPIKGADVVTGIPIMGSTIAEGFARASGIPYGTRIIPNRYRDQTRRPITIEEHEKRVKINFSVLHEEVRGKSVVLVDNRIGSGVTSRRIVEMLRNGGNGAKEIHLRIASPFNQRDCPYGQPVEKSHSDFDENQYDSIGILSKEDIFKAINYKLGNYACTHCIDS